MDKRETQVPYIKPCVFRISPLNFHIHNQPSTSMYKLQISLVPINQRQTGPRYVHSSPSPIIMQEILPCQCCGGFFSCPFCVSAVPIGYQGMAPSQQYQQDQYQERSSGPSRNQNRNGHHKAETLYSNHLAHESSGTVLHDGFTGFNLGNPRIDANDRSGKGKVWRTPSKNPLMIDRNLT